MRATSDNQTSQLRAVIDALRPALRSRLAVFRNRQRAEQLERDLKATRQAHIEQVTDLNRQIEPTRQANIEQVTDLNRQIEAIQAAYGEQVQRLEQQISA